MSTTTRPAQLPHEQTRRFLKWHRRILGICLIIFAFEVGTFLIVFPWLRDWDLGWVPLHAPRLTELWMSRYFRGALSGLGLLNIYVALAELVKQIRQAFRPSAP